MAIYRAGELTERVELLAPVRQGDGAGGSSIEFEPYDEVFALVRPLSGGERQAAQRTDATANYLVVIRNRADIEESHAIRWRGREMNIRFLKNRGHRAQFLEIEAEMGAPL